MRILIVGSGGREHALAWQLARHGHELWCAPGNAGTAGNVEIDILDSRALADFCVRERVDLAIAGPEAPLVAGLADDFAARGLRLFGPTAAAARLEGDKAFAKRLMASAGIPTAEFAVFEEFDAARDYLRGRRFPLVVKAAGLAAGKGVIVCPARADAERALTQMMRSQTFGPAGLKVVIEEFLDGEEVSIIGLCDGRTVRCLAPSQDHKRLLDGDEGPNTGGMGAYAPAPAATAEVRQAVDEQVFQPLLAELAREGLEYRGVIYAGLMLTARGLRVLEFNCRFGDPEAQVVLPLLESDLGELCLACIEGRLGEVELHGSGRHALCVVLASGGYPDVIRRGLPITGDLVGGDDVVVFHAGTKRDGDRVVTSGGRVLGVTGIGDSLSEARDRAYAAVAGIEFEGRQFRTDIGRRGLAHSGG
ncbi:MAG TPA: phosphoribosylamine--glycine ligase [candidate division WOR-3 bacterium]|uniref:Phosphoribosylamine--glycine ligase n=1 Tax=candidate division WOR-3 bacterium TaxID=2052148 RepID=A0A7V0XF98_UNCW3|nr:phosphoribosylamine--glycine ligase [candidate division WOR-3 bacterium]